MAGGIVQDVLQTLGMRRYSFDDLLETIDYVVATHQDIVNARMVGDEEYINREKMREVYEPHRQVFEYFKGKHEKLDRFHGRKAVIDDFLRE